MSKSLLSQNKPISTAPVRVQQTKLTSSLSSAALSSNQQKLSSNTAVNPSVAGDTVVSEITEHHKIPKPPASEVANKIFSILFISDPITVVEICKQLPEVPRESIQSVLEVLQVLGLICQSSILKEPTSSRSSATNMIFLYSLTDYAKFSSAFPINNLETEVKSKQKEIVEVEARNNQLQELTALLDNESMNTEEKLTALRDTLDGLLLQNPALWNDPLYQAVIAYTGNTFHTLKSEI